ncbi:MAG: hypothetical protein ACOX52_15165 [Verrucomicrobiota bacterium]
MPRPTLQWTVESKPGTEGSRAEAQRRGGVFQLAWGGGTGIDFDFDSDNDLTDRQPLLHVHVHVLASSSCT